METASVVVRPIHAKESRIIRLARLTTLWTAIVGMLPDLIELVLNLVLSDPHFAETIAGWFPRPFRYVAMTVLITYAQKQIQLRKTTTAPIIGTACAESREDECTGEKS